MQVDSVQNKQYIYFVNLKNWKLLRLFRFVKIIV